MAYSLSSITDFGAVDSNKHGLTDSWKAIQDALNETQGKLLWPAGRYDISKPLSQTKATLNVGEGRGSTALFTMGDFNAITFGAGSYGGLRDIGIYGSGDPNAASNVVVVGPGLPIFIRDCIIWGGAWAFVTNGADGTMQDCFLSGGRNGGNIYSGGANWYLRVKSDTNGPTVPYGFYQGASINGPGGGVMENHFSAGCDFSNNWSVAAVAIDDPTTSAITYFDQCVIGGFASIKRAIQTTFTGCEMGSGYNESLVIDGGGNWCSVPSQWTGPGPRTSRSYNLGGFA